MIRLAGLCPTPRPRMPPDPRFFCLQLLNPLQFILNLILYGIRYFYGLFAMGANYCRRTHADFLVFIALIPAPVPTACHSCPQCHILRFHH